MARSKKDAKGSGDSGAPEPLVPEVVDDDDDELLAGDDAYDATAEVDQDPEQIDAELAKLAGTQPTKLTKRSKAGGDRVALIKRDPLTAYVQETKRYPLMTREQEHEVAVKWVEEGDVDAARKLIESNLRLVVKIAYEYRRAHRNLLDLVQEGNIGLMNAVRKYDPYRGVKLSSYAAWWIRAYMLKFILNNWRMVKIGTTQAQRKLFFNLRKEKERLEHLGFAPDSKMLAESLDVREKDVIEMEKRLSAPDASMDAPLGSDDGDGPRTRYDVFESRDERPDEAVEKSEFQALLSEKLEAFGAKLEGREATIFRDRWLTDSPMTLQAIGDKYGVSRERARQIEKRMLGRLRTYLEAELGSAVDIDALSRE